MAYRNPKTFAHVLAGLLLTAFLGLLGCYGMDAGGTSRRQRNAEVFQLRTDSLPTPLVIPEDPLKRSVTSMEIRGELGGASDGKGTITLDETTLTFNEFGDALKAKPEASEPCPVAFRQVQQVVKDEKRRLYEIVFADGSFPKRMLLVLSEGTKSPHRLIIRRDKDADRTWGNSPANILDLHGLPQIKERLPDAPQRPSFDLTTLSSYHGRDGGLHRLNIHGSVNGPVEVDLDPNYLGFNAFGDATFTTQMGYTPIKATLKRIEIPDPAKKGRRLFEILTAGQRLKARYFLVLSPTEAGPHRVLIREGDTLRQVLPLHDPLRSYQRTMQPQLEETPLQERRAVADLRKTIGYQFRFTLVAQRVVAMSFLSNDDADRIGLVLRHLKNLRSLDFNGSRLNPVGVPAFHDLTKLERLGFSVARVDDRGLASMKDLTQLRELSFYCCQGITDKGLVHLAGLKKLKSLRLYRED